MISTPRPLLAELKPRRHHTYPLEVDLGFGFIQTQKTWAIDGSCRILPYKIIQHSWSEWGLLLRGSYKQ